MKKQKHIYKSYDYIKRNMPQTVLSYQKERKKKTFVNFVPNIENI